MKKKIEVTIIIIYLLFRYFRGVVFMKYCIHSIKEFFFTLKKIPGKIKKCVLSRVRTKS